MLEVASAAANVEVAAPAPAAAAAAAAAAAPEAMGGVSGSVGELGQGMPVGVGC